MSDSPEREAAARSGRRALPGLGAVARGSVWSTTGRLLPQTYSTVVSIVAARALGAEDFGRLVFVGFVSATLATLLTLGLPTAVLRHVAVAAGEGRASEIRALVAWSWRIAIAGAGGGFLVLAAAAWSGAEPGAAWLVAGIVCATAVLHTIPSALLLGLQRFREASIVGLVTGAVAVGAKLAVLALGGGIVELVAVDALVGCVNLAGTQVLALRVERAEVGSGAPAPELIRRTRTFALIASLGIVINYVVFRKTELFFLNHWSGDVDIAVYSVAFSLVAIILLLPGALGVVVASTVAVYHGAAEAERIRRGYGRSLRIAAALAIPVTGLALAVGPSFLELVYGAEFAAAGRPLRILLVTLPLLPLMTIAQSLLLGLGRQWIPLGITATAGVLNIGFDVLLIPEHAAVGAAIANTSAQVAATVPLLVYAARCVGGTRPGWASLLGSLVASSAACAASSALAAGLDPLAGFVAGSLAFAAVFVPLAGVTSVLDREDGRWVEERTAGLLGGRVGRAARYCSGGLGGGRT